MIAPYHIEVLAHNGDVKASYRFNNLPIAIGRGYANDLVLDDPYVAARHAVIEQAEHGELHMRDLGSKNGLLSQGKRHTQLALDGEHAVKLGRTRLRVRGADYPVAAELTNLSREGWDGWTPALIGLAIVVLLSISSVWISDTEKFSAIRYFMGTALILAIVALWSGAWAFANRVFGHSARFGRHLFIVACALLLMDVWDIFSITLAYAFSLESLTSYGDHMMMLLAAAMVFFHLETINPERSRRFAALCAVLAVLGSGLLLMNNYQRYGRLGSELYMSYILPPQVRLSPNQPAMQFIDEAGSLKALVDEERLKPVNSDLLLLEEGEDEPPADDAQH